MPTTDGVPPEPRAEPIFEKIIDLLKPGGKLENAEKAQAEAMSALGKLHQTIEKDMRGNRAAVQLIRKLDKMSVDKRNDYIRTLEPLLVERGYILDKIDPDLADGPPIGKEDKGEEPAEDDEPGDNSSSSALDKVRGNLTNARAHLSGEPPAKPVGGAEAADAFVAGEAAKKPGFSASRKKDGVDE